LGILDRFRRKKEDKEEKAKPREEEATPPPKPKPSGGIPKKEEGAVEEVAESKELEAIISTKAEEAMKEEQVSEEERALAERIKEESAATVEMDEGDKKSLKERIKKAVVEYANDHKNWSDRLVEEEFFESRSEAKAYASLMRARGYYAKMVRVKGGYKVYVYAKKGSASVILTGSWKGINKLQKMNTKAFRLGKKGSAFKLDMGRLNTPSVGFNLPSMDFNFTIPSDYFNDFKNLNLGNFDIDFDFGLDLGGLGGEKRGKKKRR